MPNWCIYLLYLAISQTSSMNASFNENDGGWNEVSEGENFKIH